MANTVLHIDASARIEGSQSRALSKKLVEQLAADRIIRRDVGAAPPAPVTDAWVNANFTPEENRTPDQIQTLAESDELVEELFAADALIIGLPIYNFGPPAAFKAWIDKVARARKTFKYTDAGPVGLLEGKKAYVVVVSGGTEAGSAIDFATPYVRHVLGFLGIHDVEIVAADQLMFGPEPKIAAAEAKIAQIA